MHYNWLLAATFSWHIINPSGNQEWVLSILAQFKLNIIDYISAFGYPIKIFGQNGTYIHDHFTFCFLIEYYYNVENLFESDWGEVVYHDGVLPSHCNVKTITAVLLQLLNCRRLHKFQVVGLLSSNAKGNVSNLVSNLIPCYLMFWWVNISHHHCRNGPNAL